MKCDHNFSEYTYSQHYIDFVLFLYELNKMYKNSDLTKWNFNLHFFFKL